MRMMIVRVLLLRVMVGVEIAATDAIGRRGRWAMLPRPHEDGFRLVVSFRLKAEVGRLGHAGGDMVVVRGAAVVAVVLMRFLAGLSVGVVVHRHRCRRRRRRL